MSDDFSFMRSGIGAPTAGSREGGDRVRLTALSLIQVFSEDALRTAAEYCIGSHRKEVTGEDMHKALMFQARMFFQTVENLEGRVDEAIRAWRERDEENNEETDTDDTDTDEDDGSDASEDDDDAFEERRRCAGVVKRVDAIVASWETVGDEFNKVQLASTRGLE